MKHLMTKRIFESIEYKQDNPPEGNITEDVRDILLELEDNGFVVTWLGDNHRAYDQIPFTVYTLLIFKYQSVEDGMKPYPLIKYSEVEDVIDRLKDYLGDKFIMCYVGPLYGSWVSTDQYQHEYETGIRLSPLTSSSVVNGLKITFKIEESVVPEEEANESVHIIDTKPNETIDDLKDICMELQDEGFTIKFHDQPSNENRLIISKPVDENFHPVNRSSTITPFEQQLNLFDCSEVDEVIEWIKSYLGDRLKKISMYAIKSYPCFDITKDVFINAKYRGIDKVRMIEIKFDL